MARGKKTGGNDFKPGNKSAVGKGRPRLSEDLKNVKPITPDLVSRIISKFSDMTREEISAFLKDPNTPMMYVAIGSILVKAAKDSDHGRFEFLLRRSIGNVKDDVDGNNRNVTVTLAYDHSKPLSEDNNGSGTKKARATKKTIGKSA